MAKAKSKGIKKVKGGYKVDVLDSRGRRHRRVFKEKADAIAYRDEIAALKSKGEFFADSSKATFNQALDLLLARSTGPKRRPCQIRARFRARSRARAVPDGIHVLAA